PDPQKFDLVSKGRDAAIYIAKQVRPRVWIAATAQRYDSSDQVLDRVAKMDFDPQQLVLLDRQIEDPLNRQLATEQDAQTQPSAGPLTAIGFVQQKRPEVVSIILSQGGGGWLVLADTYFPGWTATIIPVGGKEQPAAIWPAY